MNREKKFNSSPPTAPLKHPRHKNGAKTGAILCADHIAKLTADAVTSKLAAVRAAQENLGHTSPTTTERHYLTPI